MTGSGGLRWRAILVCAAAVVAIVAGWGPLSGRSAAPDSGAASSAGTASVAGDAVVPGRSSVVLRQMGDGPADLSKGLRLLAVVAVVAALAGPWQLRRPRWPAAVPAQHQHHALAYLRAPPLLLHG